jgi:hypothetical protein
VRVQAPGLGPSVETIIRTACMSLGLEPWGGPSEDGWSKHRDFLRCPYRYYLKHVRRVGPLVVAVTAPGLDVGSVSHLILACHYARKLPDDRYPGFRVNCPEPLQLLEALKDAGLPMQIAMEAERLYEGYVEKYVDDFTPVAVEMSHGVIGIHTCRYDVVGYIEDGLHDGLWIVEHKNLSERADVEDYRFDGEVLGEVYAEQLRHVDDIFGMRPNGACLNALIKAKIPRYQRLWLSFPPSILNEYADNRGRWGQQIVECTRRGVWPKNLYGCKSSFRRCRFWDHCRSQDESQLVLTEAPESEAPESEE